MSAEAIAPAVQMIKDDEGCELNAYPDPESDLGKACAAAKLPMVDYQQINGWQAMSGDPWTIGYGQTGDGIRQGVTWTQEQADDALAQEAAALDAKLSSDIACYGALNPVRQAVLIDAAYNMGVVGLLAFRHMLAYLAQGNMDGAAGELLNSDAARELPNRYGRLANYLRSGTMTT